MIDLGGLGSGAREVLARSLPARWSLRCVLLLGGLVYALWGVLYRGDGAAAVDPIGERLAIAGFGVALFGLSFLPRFQSYLSSFACVLAMVGIGHLFVGAARNQLGMRYVFGIVVVFAGTMPLFSRARTAIFYGAYIAVLAAVVAAVAPGVTAAQRTVFIARMATALLAVGLATWRVISFASSARQVLLDQIQKLQTARAEVKQLQGLLPICMHCMKIRDDRSTWQKLEHYIEAHSHAQFSHALCEECLEKHYPDNDDPTQVRARAI